MRHPLATALLAAAVAATTGCADDVDLSGPAPTPFWMDAAGDAESSDASSPSDAGAEADGSSGGDSAAPDGAASGDTLADTAAPDAGGTDAGGTDAGGTDAGAVDTSGADTGAADTGGADSGSADGSGAGDANDAGTADTADSGADVSTPEDKYFVSWAESAQQLQDPSPFGSSWAEQRTTTLGLVKISWNGDSGTRWLQPCAMHTTTVFGTKTLYSAAFLKAIPVPGVPISRVGEQWTQSEEFIVVGLKDGYEGAMPALGQKDHPALVDGDKDGLPGVTVNIDNNLLGKQNLQVAQRQRSSWTAKVQANGEVAAEPKVTTEQVVVAASLSLLVVQNKTKPVTGKPGETLRLIPLAQPMDCTALLANPSKWTGKSWPP